MSELVPETGEILVNSFTANNQDDPRITALPDGGFIVVWESFGPFGVGNTIFQQVYDSDGNTVGGNVRVNTTTTISQSNPRVEVLADGSWIVTWNSYGGSLPETEIMARVFAPDGTPTGPQFQVNSFAAGQQDWPEITALNTGGFLVVWFSDGPDGDGHGIRGQRYDSAGNPLGAEIGINSTTVGDQRAPQVDTFSDGRVIVTWQNPVYDVNGDWVGGTSHGQILSPIGRPIGGEFELFSGVAFNGAFSVATFPDGRFVVVGWSATDSGNEVVGQMYDANGVPLAPPVTQSVPGASVYEPRVEILPDGGFVVTVTVDVAGNEQMAGNENTYMQRFDAEGELVGDPVQVNTTVGTGVYQDDADVTVLEDGRIAVVWEGYNQDGDGDGVFLRIFESQLIGTDSADVIEGTNGADIIKGRGGNDDLRGRSGADVIEGGNGHDEIRGEGSRDVLNGDRGNDTVDGGLGNDRVNGGGGNDVLIGGGGNDFLNGGAGSDEFHFNAGRDRIVRFDDNRDEIVLDGAALGVTGYLASEIIDEFGSIVGNRAVFDFGGGDTLTVNGVTDLNIFLDDIIIG
ncbi:calcium-binding protein [Phaeobacter marinintestinus]|uniref:calcium-binding protein n=1 Tax=Falsiphaeobacter marinintestinus TaxID=1492905 RepID=UPI002482B684|nr:calcium-binding protein [Phaeobacter marinintestinus]